MAVPYPRVLPAIVANSTSGIRALFEGLTPTDVVELATFIGPERLTSVARQAATAAAQAAARPRPPARLPVPAQGRPPAAPNLPALLAETLTQGFGLQPPTRVAIDAATRTAVAAALRAVSARRAAGPLLTMTADVSRTLPAATANPPSLSRADYEASAQRLRCEVAAITAVAEVESSGAGFEGQGRPKILFEAHYFARLTGRRFNQTHPHLSFAYDRQRARIYYRWDQYQRLYEALLLDVDAALQSASWGKFQIMGQNHNGWPSVRPFVNAMFVSEANHLISFEAYCADNNLVRFIRARDWLRFAQGYNGQDQQGYDTRMAQAYARAQRR